MKTNAVQIFSHFIHFRWWQTDCYYSRFNLLCSDSDSSNSKTVDAENLLQLKAYFFQFPSLLTVPVFQRWILYKTCDCTVMWYWTKYWSCNSEMLYSWSRKKTGNHTVSGVWWRRLDAASSSGNAEGWSSVHWGFLRWGMSAAVPRGNHSGKPV